MSRRTRRLIDLALLLIAIAIISAAYLQAAP